MRTAKWMMVIGVLVAVPLASATPANQQRLIRQFEDFLPPKLHDCTTCHKPTEVAEPESLEEIPHNAFGDALRERGKATPLPERVLALIDVDSDGDGVANLDELLLGTLPGDASSMPDAKAKAPREAFLAYKAWDPYTPVARPEVPSVEIGETAETAEAGAAHPVDAFLERALQRKGLRANPPADRASQLRRLHLDLTGLLPSADELAAFLADDSPYAYERVADRLLADPAHGERWGRHWMDVWRYSDWAGYKAAVRESQKHIWRWRDWIVDSINAGKPYDRMVQEMLAGDELAPGDEEALAGTGYLVRSYYRNRDQWMDDVVRHTSQAFMGLTIQCAKCHDHFYDPVSMDEYYQLRAIFQPYNVRTDRVRGELDVAKTGLPRVYDKTPTIKTFRFIRGDERNPDKEREIPPGVPSALGGSYEAEALEIPLLARQPGRRAFVREMLLDTQRAKLDGGGLKEAAGRAELAALESLFAFEELDVKTNAPAYIALATETVRRQRESAYHAAALALDLVKTAHAKAEKTQEAATSKTAKDKAKRALAVQQKKLVAAEKALAKADKDRSAKPGTKVKGRGLGNAPATSTGRRLAYARWLTRANHPLTARVAVNHMWMRHFKTGLVSTPADFGGNGAAPSHPELLDWLAAEFVDSGWDMKHIHRLIVTSEAYRRGTGPRSDAAADPDNILLWRFPPKRMEGELVRDNLLHVAGRLDPAMGGPDIANTAAQTSRRRSIYLRHAHEKLVKFVQLFDGPKVSECYQREDSIRPQQALALANSQLTVDGAAALASELADDPDFLDAAFLRLFARSPNAAEREQCAAFLEDRDPERGRQLLLVALLNLDEFVMIR